jgi:hypothetical protein
VDRKDLEQRYTQITTIHTHFTRSCNSFRSEVLLDDTSTGSYGSIHLWGLASPISVYITPKYSQFLIPKMTPPTVNPKDQLLGSYGNPAESPKITVDSQWRLGALGRFGPSTVAVLELSCEELK